jgi:hypothetical protein
MRGSLTDCQQEILRPLVVGNTVHDLGAGDLSLARTLIECGAKGVVAIDKEMMLDSKVPSIETIHAYFDQYANPIDIAFLSWPVNWSSGVLRLVRRARLVIYLGKNTGGIVCGYPDLWWHLRTREVLRHIPGRKNSFIIYGPGTRGCKGHLPEEHAALDDKRVWTFEELEQWGLEHAFPIRGLTQRP